jgi:hypothetical protein
MINEKTWYRKSRETVTLKSFNWYIEALFGGLEEGVAVEVGGAGRAKQG